MIVSNLLLSRKLTDSQMSQCTVREVCATQLHGCKNLTIFLLLKSGSMYYLVFLPDMYYPIAYDTVTPTHYHCICSIMSIKKRLNDV